MSILYLQLASAGRVFRSLDLSAEEVIDPTLIISQDRVDLPTWISVENVVAEINRAGFMLAGQIEVFEGIEVDGELLKIAALINQYYIPTLKSVWVDQILSIEVTPIPLSDSDIGGEVGRMRQALANATRELREAQRQSDPAASQQARDRVIVVVMQDVERKPELWKRVLTFLAKTAIPILFDKLIGIPLGGLIKSLLGSWLSPAIA